MELSKLIPILKQLNLTEGIEQKLLHRKFKKQLSGIITSAGVLIQIIIEMFSNEKGNDLQALPVRLWNFKEFLSDIFHGHWEYAFTTYQLVPGLFGFFIIIIGLMFYVFFAVRSFFFKYSEEAFRYTFWVEPFKHVKDTETDKFEIEPQDRFHYLLHQDIKEKLNDRIRRLFLLNPEKLDASAKDSLSSHIHIEGHYAVREIKNNEYVIHIMPSVRIGPPNNPATLSAPVKFRIDQEKIDDSKSKLNDIGSDKYNQIVERVYSSVATEIYKQIETDLNEKIALFPTKYLRAVALYNEAEDFARSNTVDAYDRAIRLYRDAITYFKVAEILYARPYFTPFLSSLIKKIRKILLNFPLLWRKEIKFIHIIAKIQIGYAKCLIYRREISALSGRDKNPLFEIRESLDEVINNLCLAHNRINKKRELAELKEFDKSNHRKNRLHTIMAFLTFPEDSWLRRLRCQPSQSLFEKQNRLLFDAYLVSAYTYSKLGAYQKASEYLDNAKAVDPQRSEKNALYHLVAGTLEPYVDKAFLLFRKATEMAPDFQIAQYLLAYYSEMKFRIHDEISEDRVKSVVDEYDKVLNINPGNIAALAAQGYLWWIAANTKEEKTNLEILKKAKKKFEDGCEVKTLLQQTYIGGLNYGLARIAAEEGEFNESYNKYAEAISADPGVGAYSVTTSKFSIASFYDYISLNILGRYTKFKENVETKREQKKDHFSENTVNKVYSFVLNDYGNACLNYFHDTGKKEYLTKAIRVYEQSTKIYPKNKIAFYNLSNAYDWEGDKDKNVGSLEKAYKLAPEWHVATIAFAQAKLRRREEKKEKGEIRQLKDELKNKKEELEKIKAKTLRRDKGVHGQPTPGQPTPGQPTPGQPTPGQPTPGQLDDLTAQIQRIEKQISEIEKEITYDYDKVDKVVRSIIERSSLSPINKDGQGVDKLLSQKNEIKKDKFNESDIEALRVWAELLSNNDKNQEAQNKAENIFEYILKEYYPDNVDVHLLLHDMNRRIMKDKMKEWLRNKEK